MPRMLQIEVLRAALAAAETTSAQLQDANTELADSLHSLHQHAQALEAQLAAQQEELGSRAAAAEAEAESAAAGRREVRQALFCSCCFCASAGLLTNSSACGEGLTLSRAQPVPQAQQLGASSR